MVDRMMRRLYSYNPNAGGGSVSDGSVTTAKLGGDITAAGKALLDDANAAAQRTTLGLGTAATSATGDFAAASHTHSIANVTGLQTALDGKQAAGSYATASHSHVIGDVTGLQTALDGKAASSHTHIIGDVTGLQTALDGKQAAGSYAAASHTHAASDITSGTIATARLGSGTADATTFLRGDNTWATPAGGGGGGSLVSLAIHADATANATLTNQAVAEQFLANNNRNIHLLDLSGATEVRLVARVVTASASANSPRLRVRYATSFTTTIGSYADIGTSEVSCALTPVGVRDSGWIALAAGAKIASCYVAVTQIGGDAAADPAIGQTVLWIR